jgi:hypothetical protein
MDGHSPVRQYHKIKKNHTQVDHHKIEKNSSQIITNHPFLSPSLMIIDAF